MLALVHEINEMDKVSKISIIRIYDEGEKFVDLQGEGEISVRTCA